jgi:hypothetical protein
MRLHVASRERSAAFRRRCLSFAKTCSMGLRSGLLGWQEDEAGAGGPDRGADRLAFVAAQIVENDDVPWLEGGDEDLVDIGGEAGSVDRPVEDAGRVDAVAAQGRQERERLPMPVRDLGGESPSARAPAPQRRHVGLGPGLVDEDEARGIDQALQLPPSRPVARHVRPVLLGRQDAFF